MKVCYTAAVIAAIITFFKCLGSELNAASPTDTFYAVALWMHDGFWWKLFFILLPIYAILYTAFYYCLKIRKEVFLEKEQDVLEMEAGFITVVSILVLVWLVCAAMSGYTYGHELYVWRDGGLNFFGELASWFARAPYGLGYAFIPPLAVAAAIVSLRTFVVGYIALTTSHPAVPVVTRSLQRRRPSAEVLHALAQIMHDREIADARFAALVEQLPPWSQWAWGIRYRKMRRDLLRTRGAVEAQTSVIEEEIRLAEGVGNLERRKAARERRYGHGR